MKHDSWYQLYYRFICRIFSSFSGRQKCQFLRCLIYFLCQITPLYSSFCILPFSWASVSFIGDHHQTRRAYEKDLPKTSLNVILHISNKSELCDLCWTQRNKDILKKIRLPQKTIVKIKASNSENCGHWKLIPFIGKSRNFSVVNDCLAL